MLEGMLERRSDGDLEKTKRLRSIQRSRSIQSSTSSSMKMKIGRGEGERTLSRQHQRQVSVVSAFPWQWCANKLVSLDEAKAKTSLRENDGQSAGQGS